VPRVTHYRAPKELAKIVVPKAAIRTFGKRILGVALQKALPAPLSMALDGLDYADSILMKTRVVVNTPLGQWSLVGVCKGGGPVNGWVGIPSTLTGAHANGCLGLQTGTNSTQQAITADPINLGLVDAAWNIDFTRYQHVRNYTRDKASSTPKIRTWVKHNGLNRPTNPNVHRWMNPTPQPLVYPVPSPKGPPYPTKQSAVEIAYPTRIRPAPRTLPAARSRPPGRNEKPHQKTRAAQAAVIVAKILDGISEGSEVIDAVYQALPEHIRTEWEKTHKPPKERPGDQAGQYGIDGADWKLPAIYKYWKHLDAGKAVTNILKNEAEDRAYGAYHKAKNDLTFQGAGRPSRRRKRGGQ
jgi:hypothetical protein